LYQKNKIKLILSRFIGILQIKYKIILKINTKFPVKLFGITACFISFVQIYQNKIKDISKISSNNGRL